jgi:uncharacterized membrane protein (DUF2068 family)
VPGVGTTTATRKDRLLPWIAAERGVRAVGLVAIGIVLLTHTHTDWGGVINDVARSTGVDPSSNGIHALITKVRAISPHRYQVFGLIAFAYAALEGAEAYGLWRRRLWGEYLTVVATSLLFIPEVYELSKSVTVFKVGALVVNVAIVVYLIVRLRRYGG